MKLQDINDAIAGNDRDKMRESFRALVNPHATFKTGSPGLLIVALNRLCVSLKNDSAEMPAGTCGALDLPPGSTYSEGSAAAKREAARLARHLMAQT